MSEQRSAAHTGNDQLKRQSSAYRRNHLCLTHSLMTSAPFVSSAQSSSAVSLASAACHRS